MIMHMIYLFIFIFFYLFIFFLGGGGVNKVHYGLCVQIDWKEMIKITHEVIYKPKGGLTGSIHI